MDDKKNPWKFQGFHFKPLKGSNPSCISRIVLVISFCLKQLSFGCGKNSFKSFKRVVCIDNRFLRTAAFYVKIFLNSSFLSDIGA
jgi:hypothetical protein